MFNGPAVRLEVTDDIDDEVVDLLVSEIDVGRTTCCGVPGLLDLSSLHQVYDIDRPALKERPFVPAHPPPLRRGRVAEVGVRHAARRRRARPPPVRVVRDEHAALHRAGGRRPAASWRSSRRCTARPVTPRSSTRSIDAAEAGKQVVALVEIKARFDEQANIKWARALERAGCHVVYGFVGLKTHCKTALVVRQEGNQIRRYAHIGTGNYNPKTAAAVRGPRPVHRRRGHLRRPHRPVQRADRLLAADRVPLAARRAAGRARRADRADRARDRACAEAGRPAHIRFKTNHLVDEQTIDALYRASRAGVRIELLVRTFCTIRAGVPGLSENIRTRSILGRFLEHSRIYYFGGGGDPEYWIGSADLMHRNLDRRVEVLCQVSDRQARAHLDRVPGPGLRRRHRGVGTAARRRVGTLRRCTHRLPGAADEAAGRPRRVAAVAVETGRRDDPRRRRRACGACMHGQGRGRARPPASLRRLVAAEGQAGEPARPNSPPRSARSREEIGSRGRGVRGASATVSLRRSRRPQDASTYWVMRHSTATFVAERRGRRARVAARPKAAREQLSYDVDRRGDGRLRRACRSPDSVILLVRHARAGKRSEWRGEDAQRPLDDVGRAQAKRLATLLAHFGARPRRSAPTWSAACRRSQPLAEAPRPRGAQSTRRSPTRRTRRRPTATEARAAGAREAGQGHAWCAARASTIPGLIDRLGARDARRPTPARARLGAVRRRRQRGRRADYYEDAVR